MDVIKNRRSTRAFLPDDVALADIMVMLDAARWAPSGKNGQPWRFVVLNEDQPLRLKIARLTVYKKWVEKAPCLIIVLLDKSLMYDRHKDTLAIGACCQNILLAAHSLGLGTCWLGEILNQDSQIRELLALPEHLDIEAVIAVGYPDLPKASARRRDIQENITLR